MLDVALRGADGVDHRLARVRGLERASELAADPELDHRERLVHPFPKRAGGAGMRVVELVGEPGELLERALIVGLSPRPAEPGLDRWAVTLGEVLHDVSFFVPQAALDRDLAEHRAHGLAQRLDAVNAVANRLADRPLGAGLSDGR